MLLSELEVELSALLEVESDDGFSELVVDVAISELLVGRVEAGEVVD